jgi:hypothetical protein
VAALTFDRCVCDPVQFCSDWTKFLESSERDLAFEGLARAIEEKMVEPGLAIVPGEAFQRLSDDELSAWFGSVANLLGTEVAQNLSGEIIVEVVDRTQADAPARGYQTSERMLLHSDASDIAGLLCISPAMLGGDSLFASSRTLHDAVAVARPDLLEEFFSPWRWNVANLGLTGEDAELKSPIFSLEAGELSCRYGSHFLRSASRAEHPLTSRQSEALDTFEATAQREELLLRCRLERGDSVWMNNYKVLHGRDAFDGMGGRRFQRRWIRRKKRPGIEKGFAAFDAKILARFGEIDAE